MAEIPHLEIYGIIILPPDKEKKIKLLEEKLGEYILVSFENFAYAGKLNKKQSSEFYIEYQNSKGIEEKMIELNSTNVIFVKQS